MSKPVNTVAIGSFVAGALIILFSLAFYIGGSAFGGKSEPGLLIFDGSIKGLNMGAVVAFKGVPIGEVTGTHVVIHSESLDVLTPVEIKINRGRIKKVGDEENFEPSLQELIDRGLRAQLKVQSMLTGLLYVQLDYFPGTEVRYTAADIDVDTDEILVIPTIPTDLERFANSVEKINWDALFADITRILEGADKLLNSAATQGLPQQASDSLAAIQLLSQRLEGEIAALSPELNRAVSNTGDAMSQVNQELPQLSASARQTLDELTQALEQAGGTLKNVDYLLSDDSAVVYDVRNAAQELGAAGRALQSLAETLETQPESLLKGKSPLSK